MISSLMKTELTKRLNMNTLPYLDNSNARKVNVPSISISYIIHRLDLSFHIHLYNNPFGNPISINSNVFNFM